LGCSFRLFCFLFFFQAEDGIRDRNVTGVQTCALPISNWQLPIKMMNLILRLIERFATRQVRWGFVMRSRQDGSSSSGGGGRPAEIGRASCREREEIRGGVSG